MEKEKFINEILNSANVMENVTPSDLLLYRIINSIKNKSIVKTKWVWIAAASIMILISLNSFLVFSNSNKKINDSELLANSIANDNQLYN